MKKNHLDTLAWGKNKSMVKNDIDCHALDFAKMQNIISRNDGKDSHCIAEVARVWGCHRLW